MGFENFRCNLLLDYELMFCLVFLCTGTYGKTIFCAISVPRAGWMVLGS